jgi:NTP pyrophosphatase (non-canonical NTP hydrolase)
MINVNDLRRMAGDIVQKLDENGFPARTFEGYNRQALAIAEEAGEFVGAYRRWSGQARRTDTYEHVSEELADVIITAFVMAEMLGMEIDKVLDAKLEVIFSRGWREDGGTGAAQS